MQIQRQQSGPVPLLIAITVPLAVLGLAYALSAISSRLLYIGPLDRATFGWIVVFPVSWGAPGIAGLVWSHLPDGKRRIAAFVVGGTIAVVAGVLLANGIDYVGCAPVLSWTEDLPKSLAVGLVIGAGPAIGALVAASVADQTVGIRRVVAAVATGAIIGFVGLFAALETFSLFFPGVSCVPVPT